MLDDLPMGLGDHLDELRSRLLKVILVLVVGVVVGMAFQVQLKGFIELPLRRAVTMADPASVERIGLQSDPEKPIFRLDHLAESAINAVKISFFFALAAGFPVLVYQLWAFIRPGLKRDERAAGFLFIPAAVIFFYGGVLFGYLIGLPFLYQLLIEWTANENAILDLRQTYYLGFFVMMTLAFGLVMDIPWLVMVLVRMRVVTPNQIAAKRKVLIFVGAVVAAIATPPDPVSQVAMFGLVVVLFESGLLASRFLYRAPERVTDEIADSVPPPDGDGGSPPNNDGSPPWMQPEADGPTDPEPEASGHPASEDEVDDDGLGPVPRPSAWDHAVEEGDASDDRGGKDEDEERP